MVSIRKTVYYTYLYIYIISVIVRGKKNKRNWERKRVASETGREERERGQRMREK